MNNTRLRNYFVIWLLVGIHLLGAQAPELGLPVGHTQALTSVAYSPDGRWILTGSLDKLAKIWDLEGRVLRTLNPGTGAITGVGVSPQGTYVYTQSKDSTVVWTLDGRVVLRCSNAPVFSPDETKLLYASGDTNYLHNLNTGNRQPFAIENRFITNRFSPDGQYFLHLTRTKLECWTADGKRKWTVALPEMTAAAEFSPDQACILVAFADGTLTWYNLAGKLIKRIGKASEADIMFSCSAIGYPISWVRLGFSKDKKKVFCSSTSAAQVYDIAGAGSSNKWLRPDFSVPSEVGEERSYNFGHILEISPDGSKVLWRNSSNKQITLRNRQGNRQWSIQRLYGPNCSKEIIDDICNRPANAVFDPAGSTVLVGLDDGSAEIIDLDGTVIRRFQSGLAAKTTHVAKLSEEHALLLNLSKKGDSEKDDAASGEMAILDLKNNRLQAFDPAAVDTAAVAYRRFITQINARKGLFVAYNGHYTIEGDEDPNFELSEYLNPGRFFSSTAGAVMIFEQGRTAFQFWDGVVEGWSSVSAVCLSPDEKYLLTSPTKGSPRVWDFQCLRDFANPTSVYHGNDDIYLTRDSIQECFVRTLERAPVRSYFSDFAQDKQSLLIRENEISHWISLEGDILQTFRGHRLDVIDAIFLQNDRFVLSWSEDHTIRLWDTATGKELATIILMQGHEWVITTPEGLFDASPGAMRLMYFMVGLEVIELEQLKQRYYEPGLLQHLLGFSQNRPRSVEGFGEVPLYPTMEARLSEDGRKLHIRLTPRSGGIGKLSFFVNGKEVKEDANSERAESVTIDLTKFGAYYLPGKTNKLVLRAYNAKGWLPSAPLELDYNPPVVGRGSSSATGGTDDESDYELISLYAVVVGTADYAGNQLDLTFADKDADYFSQALRAAAPKIYDRVEVVLLNTDAKSADRQDISDKISIEKAFTNIAANAKAQDVLVIYFSGHGTNYGTADNSQFYYLTKDIRSEDLKDPEILNSYGISSAELAEWIRAIPALKQVMIIDACHSGKIVEDLAIVSRDINSAQIRALERLKDRTGMFILTGSAADKLSYEAGQYGQGLLTYSLLEGMGNQEVLTSDKRVDVMRLFQHVRDQVPELSTNTKGIQVPVLAFPVGGESFDIGIVDASVREKIPLVQIKPVFVRNVFLDSDELEDVLGLGQALGDYFRRITVKGAQAELIYVDAEEYVNAYSMKGLYTVEGDEVAVRVRLRKDKTVVGEEFKIAGKSSDVPGLVQVINKRVLEILNAIAKANAE